MARHLYNFFVADEVQVPSWLDVPPRDPEAVNAIADVFTKSGFEIKETLRFIFNSSFFKDEAAWFAKVKNPAEVVAGTIRLIGDFQEPKPGVLPMGLEGRLPGPGPHQPAQRGGLAHRFRVDRHRLPGAPR